MNTTLPAAYAPLLLRNVIYHHHQYQPSSIFNKLSFFFFLHIIYKTQKKKKEEIDEKKKKKRRRDKNKKNCWALTSTLYLVQEIQIVQIHWVYLYKYYSWTHTRIVVKKSMYSSSSDDSDRYSDSDRERTGDDGSIPVANKEESTLLNYEHEYDDYAKDVIGENLGDNDTTSSFSGLHKLSTEKYGKGKGKKGRKKSKGR